MSAANKTDVESVTSESRIDAIHWFGFLPYVRIERTNAEPEAANDLKMKTSETLSLEDLTKRQKAGLWLDGTRSITDIGAAGRFLSSVSFALRYNASRGLPLAAMFDAVGEKRRAIEFTNSLLASAKAIETNLIAGRLALMHKQMLPAVYGLRKRWRARELTKNAKRLLELIDKEGTITAGIARRYLGISVTRRPDPADLALKELQLELLIDRGPSSIPAKGIPYLSPEGYPYRLLEKTHARLIGSNTPTVNEAVCFVILRYLQAAVFITPRKLASLFKLLFTENEMKDAIDTLALEKQVQHVDKYVVCLIAGKPGSP